LLAGDFAFDGCPMPNWLVTIDAASSDPFPRLEICVLMKSVHEAPSVGQNSRIQFCAAPDPFE
jgi:hypothetical protein